MHTAFTRSCIMPRAQASRRVELTHNVQTSTWSSTISASSRLRSSLTRSGLSTTTTCASPRATRLVSGFHLASSAPSTLHVASLVCVGDVNAAAADASEYEGFARLRVEGLHFEATNIAFWVNKKTGFMPFEDAGVLDVIFGPKGISFDVTLEPADEEDNETFFTVKDVEVTLDNFDYVLSKNSHWFATWFAKPVLRAFVKVRRRSRGLELEWR
jgi:hypothetical protein